MKTIPVLLALVFLAVASVAGSPAPGQDAARIMSYEQYARADRPVPCVLEYGAGEGRLLLVGNAHTLDTNSATVALIGSEFGRFEPTVGGPQLALEELGNSYGKHFPAGTAWRSVPLEWFSPLTRGHCSNDMARASGRFRDANMLARIVGRVRNGDRVFVAVGSTHAYMLEPALKEALGKPAPGPDGVKKKKADPRGPAF